MTSITGTSLKSPMSGTRTSAMPAGALVGAGGGDTVVFGARPARRGLRACGGVEQQDQRALG